MESALNVEKIKLLDAKVDKQINRGGVTLIELLVVVAIISVLTAMMIPRLRTINKDRNIREAARVVGSVFASASQRAIAEGTAGVLLERNPNFIDGGVNFACTTMFTLRSLPPYLGDQVNSKATINGGVVTIPTPFEHTLTTPVVQKNDYISLNYSSIRYRISAANAVGTNLTLTLDPLQFVTGGGFLPVPPDVSGPGVDFVVYRQPQKLESSRVDLPEGYVIDLRYSGPLVDTDTPADGFFDAAVFNQATGPDQIAVIYNNSGAIDFLYYNDSIGNTISIPPTSSIYWYVAAYEIDSTVMPIFQTSNIWVTSNTTGGVNVGYTVPATPNRDFDGDGKIDIADQILEARSIADTQQSAAQ